MQLLDTDILVDILRGHPAAVSWFATLAPLPAVPGLTVMELIQGARNQAEVMRISKMVAPLARAWPSEAECELALTWFSRLHPSHGVGLIDALIAAVAVSRSATLCTFNTKHYVAIPGLSVIQPYVR